MILHRLPPRRAEREARSAVIRAAFTLMEMLIVVAIIVALASLGGYYFIGALKSNQKKLAQTACDGMLKTAVTSYMIDHGGQPPQNLRQLLQTDQFGGPYITSDSYLKDPWGNYYGFNPVAQNPETGAAEFEIYTTCPADNTYISNLRRQR